MREFAELAFARTGIHLEWQGRGVEEVGRDQANGRALVRVDERYIRPSEVGALLGNPAKAQKTLGWSPTVLFHELVNMMVDADLAGAEKDLYLEKGGYGVKHFHE